MRSAGARRPLLRRGMDERHDPLPPPRVPREHRVIDDEVSVRSRHESREPLEELDRLVELDLLM